MTNSFNQNRKEDIRHTKPSSPKLALVKGEETAVERHQFVRVEFSHFKAFKSFTLTLRHFNILVGPNNAGKSTILAAFRILYGCPCQK